MIAISQKLRPDAVEVVKALSRLGLDLHILSGDRNDAVRPVAEALGIAQWLGELKPAEKIARIETLKSQGRRILMVGDGLNDAPALAAAHVSLSPIAAADVTQAQADAVFLGERLAPVLDAITIARRARALMRENLWLAAVYNAHRGSGRHCRRGHAADRRAGDVGLVGHGDAERAARPSSWGKSAMNVLVYLVPMALGLGLIGLFAFLWALRSGQYSDVEGAALRVLSDDDIEHPSE